MGQYTNKGLYNGYKKNNQEREKLDYYATPPQEVTNILTQMNLPLEGSLILEPSCGGGHMIKGIVDYCSNCKIIATDIADRLLPEHVSKTILTYESGLDFLSDDYPHEQADYVIMNPPFSTIEPFVIRSLEIAKKGVLMLGRTQFIESQGRYENIFKGNPPSHIYQYVDRIACWKDGVPPVGASAQAYSWFYWDLQSDDNSTQFSWIRRI